MKLERLQTQERLERELLESERLEKDRLEKERKELEQDRLHKDGKKKWLIALAKKTKKENAEEEKARKERERRLALEKPITPKAKKATVNQPSPDADAFFGLRPKETYRTTKRTKQH